MLYVRFPLSLWNIEDLFHKHDVDVSHETIRLRWKRVNFGSRQDARIMSA
jgi:putative transposase